MNIAEVNAKRAERGWPLVAEHGTRTGPDAEGFSREVVFEPGHPWNTRGNPPSLNFGRDSLKVRFLLHGPRGSIQFLWSTGITPERQVDNRWSAGEWMHVAPSGYDVGYHADEPQYEGHDSFRCAYRPSGTCFYDGSSLAADRVLELFLTTGEDAMWGELRDRYDSLFGGGKGASGE